MKIKKGFLMREVAGKPVVIPTGETTNDFSGMIKLNETGKEIWENIENEKTEQEIAEYLATKYGITLEEASEDVSSFVNQMREEGFLED